jgi:tetratricopeptide (TPR) repeat protein
VKLAPFYVKFDLHGSEGLLACALAQLGRWDDADRHINSTLKRNPADALALYAEALCAKEDGDYGQLEATLKKMMPLNSGSHVVDALTDAQFTPLLAEKRFPELLAWALGAQRQARECVLARPNPPV